MYNNKAKVAEPSPPEQLEQDEERMAAHPKTLNRKCDEMKDLNDDGAEALQYAVTSGFSSGQLEQVEERVSADPPKTLKRKFEERTNLNDDEAEALQYAVTSGFKLPASKMPQATKDTTYPQEVTNAVLNHFLEPTANDDKSRNRSEATPVPKRADFVLQSMLEHMLHQNGVHTDVGRLINNTMTYPPYKTAIGKIAPDHVEGDKRVQVNAFVGVRLRDERETDADRQYRRESLQLAEGRGFWDAWKMVPWWRGVAADEDNHDPKRRKCRLTMLSDIAWKLARQACDRGVRNADFDKLKAIGAAPEKWAQIMEAPADPDEDPDLYWIQTWNGWDPARGNIYTGQIKDRE